MSRSPTRTPPIRISPTFLSSVSVLEDGAAAAVMRIAAHQYEVGRPMTLVEFGRRMGQDGLFLHAVVQSLSHLLDPKALADGLLVVDEVARALEHRAEIMSKRSEAANQRYLVAAASQKNDGKPIKLTRGRVPASARVASGAAAPDAKMAASELGGSRADYAHLQTHADDDGCTHVHNRPLDAHLHADDGCTHVHNRDADAQVYIDATPANVHKSALDAHMCIERDDDSDDADAHVCIIGQNSFSETAENRGFDDVDRNGKPSHAGMRLPRADLSKSISTSSSKKNERVESAREHVKQEGRPGLGDLDRMSRSPMDSRPLATKIHDDSAYRLLDEEIAMAMPKDLKPSAGPDGVPVPADLVRRLLECGPVDAEVARGKMAGWITQWGEPFVRSGVEAIPNKKIARPLSYLERILQNLVAEAGVFQAPQPGPRGAGRERVDAGGQAEQTAQIGERMPLKVKRRVTVAPGAAWQQIGWTAKGREGDMPGRRQVWRTESGDLRYMPAPKDVTVPTYQEDPGVYAFD